MSAKRRSTLAWVLGAAALAAVVLWVTWSALEAGEADGPAPHASKATEEAPSRTRHHGAPGSGEGTAAPVVAARMAPVRLTPARVSRDPTAILGEVAGVVRSVGSEAPVARAELSFAHAGASVSVTSGADGSFSFVPPEAGRYALSFATAPGHLPFGPEWGHSPVTFTTRPGKKLEGVQVFLIPAVRYTGLVVDGEGRPVSGAAVRLLGGRSREDALAPLPDRFTTDGNGTFEFHARDGAVLEAQHDAHGAGRAVVDTSVQISKRLVIELSRESTWRADRRISGHVRDADGEPVGNAVVLAALELESRAAPGSRLHPLREAQTEPDGAFTVTGLDAGLYTLRVSAPGHGEVREPGVKAGRDDLEIRLPEEASLSGVVVRASDGAPVPAFAVLVEEEVGAVERSPVTVASVHDPEGRFEIGGLAPDTYLVSVVAYGHARSEAQAATAPSSPELHFALGEGGNLSGTVHAEDGSALEGARVSVEGTFGEGPSPVPLPANAVTDAEGRFALRGIAPGLRSIMVAAEGHHARILSGLIVRAGQQARVAVTLHPVEEGERPRLELAGIGVVLAPEGDILRVGQVLEGGGAAEAGLVPGDAVVAVEGVPVGTLGFGGALERIRGPEGSTVRLRVERADGTTVDLTVTRRRIRA